MFRHSLAIACSTLVLLAPLPLSAQQPGAAVEPELRFISVTTFSAPAGADRQQAIRWIERVMVPTARLDPNILSYRAGGHRYGGNAQEMVIISEYPSWAAMDAECEACDEWFEQNRPAEGTPERAEWDEMQQAFLRLYLNHKDEIYTSDVTSFGKN